ncbi:MAG: glycosyltransferase family 1 protein [Caldicoprobacterales bacterium]|jgi:glycosyltransferase involved in cell wall biosynthesis
MIRVLHVLHSMHRGGIQAFLMNLYEHINRNKVQFDFLLHTDEECPYNEEIRRKGGKIFSVPARSQGVLANRKALNSFLQNHEYKIVHQHVSSLSYIEPLKIAKHYNVPVRIVHSHNIRQGGSFFHKYLHYLNQPFIKSYATDFFACSELAAKWLYSRRQYHAGEYKIINNGIEAEKFKFNENTRLLKRTELGIKDSAFVLGHIGRFAHQKNHEFLIEIFKKTYEKERESVLVLVGDGELRGQIEQKVNNMGLEDRVIFTGIRSDIPDLLQAMDTFVFPSKFEGLGIVLIEAQAAGLPCYTSNKVVPKEVDITGMVKFIDLEDNPNVWAQEILKGRDYKRKSNINKIVNAKYDIAQIAAELEKWYELKALSV